MIANRSGRRSQRGRRRRRDAADGWAAVIAYHARKEGSRERRRRQNAIVRQLRDGIIRARADGAPVTKQSRRKVSIEELAGEGGSS